MPKSESVEVLAEVPLASIKPSLTNPRKHFDAGELAGLAASIKEHGLLQRILVRPLPDSSGKEPEFREGTCHNVGFWEIVCGERRWRAAQKLGLARVPIAARQLSDAEVLQIQIVENLQRADVKPLEFAGALKSLRDTGLTLKQVAAKIGKSEAVVRGALLLVEEAPEVLQECVRDGVILPSVAEIICRLPEDKRVKATEFIVPESGKDAVGFRDAKAKLAKRFGPKETRPMVRDGACQCCPTCGQPKPTERAKPKVMQMKVKAAPGVQSNA